MHRISNFFIRYVPRLEHWMNLSAFGGMAAFASGIIVAAVVHAELVDAAELLYPVFQVCAIAALACGVLCRRKRIGFAAFLLAGAMMYQTQSIGNYKETACIGDLEGSLQRIEGEVVSPPAPRRGNVVFLLKAASVSGDRSGILSGKVFICTSAARPGSTGILKFDGYVTSAQNRSNRFDFDEAEFFRAGGITGKITMEKMVEASSPAGFTGRIAERFRTWLLGVFKLYRNSDHRALIRASFTGEKEYIAPEINAVFQRSGLYHLLALSGFNAAILLAAVYVLLAPFALKITVKHLIAIAILWIYNGFVGPIPSLMRAVIMATAVIGALMFQRKNYPLQTFGLAGLIWLLLSPSSLFQPGFQLSYAATFGILTIHPLFGQLYKGVGHPVADVVLRFLYGSFSVSVAAFIATLPILLYHFGTVSLYGLAANIVAIPLMSISMWAFFCAMLAAPFSMAISGVAVMASGRVLDILLAIAGFADKIPFCLVTSYAPYPELIVAFCLLVIVVLTAARENIKKVLVWGIPLLLCIVPADYLARRALAVPTVIRFATPDDSAVTAVRRPCGDTWVFCSGKSATVRRFLDREVATWRRHFPGTFISRLVTGDPKGTMIDSSRTGGRRQLCGDGGIAFSNDNDREAPYLCMFSKRTNGWALEVLYGNSALISDHTKPLGYICNSGAAAEPDTIAAAFEVLMRNARFTPREGLPCIGP